MVNFFISRPIFATVCALMIVLGGAVSIPTLPIAQYPELAAPQVQVVSNYIGAAAEVVESTVTTPLERQINGAEHMRYLNSTSSSDGTSQITVTFDVGTNKDLAAVDVQNRVNQALPFLPAEVKNTGVTILKTTPAILLAIGFYSDDGSLSNLFISNYLDLYVRDAIRRIPGAADVRIFGERRYAMRLWLDPVRLAARGLTAEDVVGALRSQNLSIAAGQIGRPPAPQHQSFQITVRAQGRLTDPRQFDDLVIKRGADGSLVFLRDVGRAELGAEDYSLDLRFDGRSAVGIGVFQQPDANALQLETAIRAELQRLSAAFPPSLKYEIAFNPTTAVRESISEVLVTLLEAIGLVVLVIFLFLQDWRATLIPAITIPVSLVGTFIFVNAFGFSINTLTLFGIVLATGLVVDDAIVVVENISRNLAEERDDPHEAARRAMREVTGAVVATSLVLIAVFGPVAFLSGTTGRLYRQFSLTIAFSVAISAFNALTLSPALAARFMRAPRAHLGVVFRGFNRAFEATRSHYRRALDWQLRHLVFAGLAFVGGLILTVLVFRIVPSGFVPDEDQNYFIIQLIGPQGASLEYMTDIAKQTEQRLGAHKEVKHVFSVLGFSFTGGGANRGIIFASLAPVSERSGASHSALALVADLQRSLGALPGAIVVPFLPPPIQGQGATGGFTLQLVDRGGDTSLAPLAAASQGMMMEAARNSQIKGVFSTFSVDDPQLNVDVNRDKALSVGVSVDQIADTLGVFFGSQYVNDFDLGPRSYRVYAQADAHFRDQPGDLGAVYVRSQSGALAPLDNFVKVTAGTAAPVISHYNLYRSVELDGTPAAGVSSGQAITAMDKIAAQVLPPGIGYEWSGLSWEEVRAGHQALIIFALGLTVVFLVLSAQYESFALPLVIILSVPLALLGALAAQKLRGLAADVFCQIGLLMLIGLASKNAILIVEFAEQLRAKGASKMDAIEQATMLRLRPILMTSLAFLIGILPLVFASGSGANARHSLGTTLFGGLLLSTLLNLFFTPAIYIMMEDVRGRFRRPGPANGISHAPR
ncbi:MAG TPA: multidrug efflux RND transporter permease subunit [Polyangia bacterium]|nr:multidrug efflux RND transporter permease subunit [Polyangia bacterium]